MLFLYESVSQGAAFSVYLSFMTFIIDQVQFIYLGLEDFIFVHLKGQRKEVELKKTEPSLGLTITDNGTGFAFVKRIKENSPIEALAGKVVKIGDHIESINNVTMVGKRHYEVAQALRDIPVGEAFIIRLIEPLQSGFSMISPKGAAKQGGGKVGSGKQTIRFKVCRTNNI